MTVSALNHVMHRISPDNGWEKGEKSDIGNNTDKADDTITTGKIIFEDLTKRQLGDFNVIPENGEPISHGNGANI